MICRDGVWFVGRFSEEDLAANFERVADEKEAGRLFSEALEALLTVPGLAKAAFQETR
jgi:hypothetical protein